MRGVKRHILCPLPLICIALITGCRDNSSAPAPNAASNPPRPSASKEVKDAAANAATEVATEVKKQAAAAFSELGKQLLDSTKSGGSDALLKGISGDFQGRVSKLGESLKTNEALMQQLNVGVQAMLGNNDVDAVGALGKLTAARLTPEQTTLAKEAYNAGAAFVTQRNFSSLKGSSSDVAKLVNSVWKGNYTEALPPLQKIYGQTTLTQPQKELLGATYDQYMPAGWKDAAGKLQQGVDALKKFGQ